MSLKQKVAQKIKRFPKGYIFFPGDFPGVDYVALKIILSRLVKDGEIVRLGNGIYLNPKRDPEIGILYPGMDEVAKAIARRDQVEIKPSGEQTINNVGLSTQVPINTVYITNGTSKTINIGKNKIVFKGKANKKLKYGTGKIGSIITAIESIGPKSITDKESNLLLSLLDAEPIDKVKKAAVKAPKWINNLILQHLKNTA
ncbi:DUF6088 family protein [[Flexibacter] sp. ATCC 35208]|uniref:DUF6088 family protein n=1 Tax=[Flexibacter] sp. ATCC 35208 TaxID=1936242 RepID=UPI00117D0E84|nr:DUF6088 family protein [[Flexibacter] sp. ATCC 35208]